MSSESGRKLGDDKQGILSHSTAESGRRGAIVLLAVLAAASVAGLIRTQWSPGILESTGLVRGWDFQQFYVAARMPANQLYDIGAFQNLQKSLLPVDEQNLVYFPLYPPMVALALKPLAVFEYLPALVVWWVAAVLCYFLAARRLVAQAPSEWRSVVIWTLAGFFPFVIAIRSGQLSPFLFLATVAGLQRRNGVLLSVLAIKPQFATGMFVYFLLRREWKLCREMMIGTCVQVVCVLAVLGPEVLVEYTRCLPIYLAHGDLYTFPDGWVHSLAGTLAFGRPIHLLVVALIGAGLLLAKRQDWRMEAATVVLFMLLLTPHLLLYDLIFLAIPAACWLPAWKWSAGLVLASSSLALPVHAALGISFVPFLAIAAIAGTWRRSWGPSSRQAIGYCP